MINFWKESFLPWGYPGNWIRNLKNIPRCVKWSFQRIIRGYSDWDCWELDTYLLELLPAALTGLKNSTHSYPAGKTYESWQEEISATIYKFLLANENFKDGFTNPYSESNLTDETLSKLYYNTEIRNQKLRTQMKNEAFDWVKENFWDLWD